MKTGKTERVVEKTEAPVAVVSDDELLSAAVPDVDAEPAVAVPTAPPAPSATVMTGADIATLVKETATAVAVALAQTGNQGLGTAIGDQISKALTQHLGQPQVNMANIKMITPFNPTGRKRELKKDFVHNGCTIHERFVSDEEIELLHQITPGTYGPSEEFPIIVSEKKVLGGKPKVHILYRESKDDRLRIKNYAPTFHALLAKLVVEAKEQRAQRRAEARAFLEATD